MRNGKTFEDGDSVGDIITRFASETSRSAGGVEGHDTTESNVDVLGLEGLEHDRGHLFSVLPGVTGGLSKENTDSLSRVNTELVVEGVVPDLLYVVPKLDDTSGDGVGGVQVVTIGKISDVFFILVINTRYGLSENFAWT